MNVFYIFSQEKKEEDIKRFNLIRDHHFNRSKKSFRILEHLQLQRIPPVAKNRSLRKKSADCESNLILINKKKNIDYWYEKSIWSVLRHFIVVYRLVLVQSQYLARKVSKSKTNAFRTKTFWMAENGIDLSNQCESLPEVSA